MRILALLVPFPSTIQLNVNLLLLNLDILMMEMVEENQVFPCVIIALVALQKGLGFRLITEDLLIGCAKKVLERIYIIIV